MKKKTIKPITTVKKPRNPKPVVKSPSTMLAFAGGRSGKTEKLKSEIVKVGKTPTIAASMTASVGRKKYGAKKMADWSSQGKKRSK